MTTIANITGYDEVIPAPVGHPNDDFRDHQQGMEGGVGGTGFTEDGLAVATAIDTTSDPEFIYAAIEYDPDSKPPLYKNRRFRFYSCLAFVVIAAVVAVVVVYVTKSSKGAEVVKLEVEYTERPTKSPTPSPTTDREASGIKEQIEAGVLQRNATFEGMSEDDPRYKALDWILHKDLLQLESDDKSLYQRYVLALLAYSFDSLAWFACGDHRLVGENTTEYYAVEKCSVDDGTGKVEEFKVWLTGTAECEWYGVICSQDGVVRGLELIGNDAIGQIPPEISQLRFLQYLALNGNCLYGTIPPEFGKMSNLLSLELHGNGLSGTLPPEMYDASKLQLLNVAMNYENYYYCTRSNGSRVYTDLAMGGDGNGGGDNNYGLEGFVLEEGVERWTSMKGLHLFDNSFYGTIDKGVGDLKYLVFLRAHNNNFYSNFPEELTNLGKLRELYLNQNGIYYDIPPTVGNMEDLEDIRLYETEMTGQIPDSFYTLQKMKNVWLQDTMNCPEIDGKIECEISGEVGFGGSIKTEIGNLKKLSQLVLNNNPFTGTLPTELGLAEDLSVIHIHQTNIQGSVPREVCLLRDKKLNNEDNRGIFYADCRPNNKTEEPFFACDCCTDCCDHTTKVCIAQD